jgi:restriction modification system DNA specificity subunit
MGGKNWAGRVPDNWNLVRFSKAYSFSRGLDIKKQDLSDHGLPVISYGQIHAKDNPGVRVSDRHIRYIPEEFVKEAQLGRALLEKGDIVFADTSEDIEGVGNMMRAAGGSTLYAGYHALIARPSAEFRHKYMAYQMISPCWRQQIQRSVQGVKVYSITQRIFNEVTILQPPHDEQRIIARFLDLKTAEIDALIEKLQREVELLERYRRELIVHTVTRGLDPDVAMRDSGVEWIGEAPSTWRPLRISALYDLRSQKVSDKEYPPLSITMNGVVPQLETVAKTNDGDNRKLVRSGDFVINSRSDRRGACGISPQDGSCSLINIVLTPKHSIDNRYFSYLFRSTLFADEFYRWGHGIHDDVWTTNWNDMKSIQVPVPPLEDQETIANYLDDRMAQTDSTVSGICKQIELLGKYRKQVISDAVTGKVRVGEVA